MNDGARTRKPSGFAVVYEKLVYGEHRWETTTITTRRGPRAAELVARVIGNKHPALRVTRYTYHGRRHGISVQDRRTGRNVWEHPCVIVPSVGELGYC